MDFGISQEGCFDRALIVQKTVPASGTGSTALPWEVPLCGTRLIPIFFSSCRKENVPFMVQKKRALRDELTDGAANSPKTGAGRHELLTELETPLPAALYLNLKSVRRRICGHGAQRGANRTPPAPLSAAAPPSNSGRGFQRGGALPSSLVPRPLGRGFQREGTAVPPLCATRGHGGRVASPMFRVGV